MISDQNHYFHNHFPEKVFHKTKLILVCLIHFGKHIQSFLQEEFYNRNFPLLNYFQDPM